MPLYNAEKFVRRSMESVLAQTHQLLELIVVDDGSTDSSLSVASAIADADARVRLLRNELNLGVAATRNHALEVARGRYVAFLDSDDRWLQGKLQLQNAAMDAAGAAASYRTYKRAAEDGRCLKLVVPTDSLSNRDSSKRNLHGNPTRLFTEDEQQ